MQIAFWSSHHGQSCTTSNTAAVAVAVALQSKGKTLVAHNHFQRSTLETCLMKPNDLKGIHIGGFANQGVDALIRLVRSGRLIGKMVPDYTWSLLPEHRLDLLPGTEKASISAISEEFLLKDALLAAREFYNHILIDIHSGLEEPVGNSILEASDLVMVCLNQNAALLDSYFSNEQFKTFFKGKPLVYLISRYDENVGVSAGNIVRRYGLSKKDVFTVTYSSAFMDACNRGSVYEFIARHMTDTRSPERAFMLDLKRIVDHVNDKF